MGTGPFQPGSACHSVLFTVASVSPYAASKFSRSAHRPISSGGTVSVPTNTVQPCGTSHPAGRAASNEGGMIAWVTRLLVMKSVSAGPATRAFCGTITRVLLVHSAIASSNTATSKPTEANCITTEPGTSRIRTSAVATRLGIPSWERTAPFGLPVDPEV